MAVAGSLEGKVALLVGLCVIVGVAAGASLVSATGSPWLGGLLGLALGLPLALFLARRFMAPVNRVLQALTDGVRSLLDADYSMSLARTRNDELGELVDAYNGVGEVLRAERHDLYQRELLLDTVIQATPLSLVLTGPTDAVIYSNTAARELFLAGQKLEGLKFPSLLEKSPAPLREAVAGGRDGLFTIETEDGPETFHLSQKGFLLNTRAHRLYLFKYLTRELSRQEVETWKKVIRVIGHELNNSLAPVSSLAHSGKLLLEKDEVAKLASIFDTIEDRTRYLKDFIDGYARFAKLPAPRREHVQWPAFIERLKNLAEFRVDGELPADPGLFDPAQLQQVIINLVKNAHESGSPADGVALAVRQEGEGVRIRVQDRGSGMSDQMLRNALLPFYSTKRTGSGLGLPLCREVMEAHGGRLTVANREDGGLAVTLWLPPGGVE